MPDARRFLTALGRVIRPFSSSTASRPRPDPSAGATASSGRSSHDPGSPGRFGPAATVELDPGRVGRVAFSYTPERDGEPDPGEVVWTWVPYVERDGRGKDRPVVVVAAGEDDTFLAVPLTSRPQEGDPDAVELGAGPWDRDGRPSWARIDRVFRIHADGMRREAASLDVSRYERVVEALARRYGLGVRSGSLRTRGRPRERRTPPGNRGRLDLGGRCRARTDDLFRVKEARYQLRQSPMWDTRPDGIRPRIDTSPRAGWIAHRRTGAPEGGVERGRERRPRADDTPGSRTRNGQVTGPNDPLVALGLSFVHRMGYRLSARRNADRKRGCGAVGSASPCQGEGREFESRHPL